MFIGANGAGKSTILEAIGLLSAAMTDRVNDLSLQRKGMRLSAPSMYKSRFKSIARVNPAVTLSLEWEETEEKLYKYDVHLTTPNEKENDYWKYHSEAFFINGEKKWGRSNASQNQSNNHICLLYTSAIWEKYCRLWNIWMAIIRMISGWMI